MRDGRTACVTFATCRLTETTANRAGTYRRSTEPGRAARGRLIHAGDRLRRGTYGDFEKTRTSRHSTIIVVAPSAYSILGVYLTESESCACEGCAVHINRLTRSLH